MPSEIFTVYYKENPDPKESEALRKGILDEIKVIGRVKPDFQPFGFFIKDEKGECKRKVVMSYFSKVKMSYLQQGWGHGNGAKNDIKRGGSSECDETTKK